ncbi:MAG: hypothetical protein IH594_00800 [Bacteroidales bacterium]|nr:hypothetical protein [Bacteroidales bacterium]
MTMAGVKWREIGRPPGSQAIEEYARGRPISLWLSDDNVSFRPRDRSNSEVSKGGTS